MNQNPRKLTDTFFNFKELLISIAQGLVITLAVLLTYQYAVQVGNTEAMVRTMVFTVLIVANIFLTLINRSFELTFIETLNYKNKLVAIIIAITIILTGFMIYINPISNFFELQSLNYKQLLGCIATGFLSVVWIDVLKLIKRKTSKKQTV